MSESAGDPDTGGLFDQARAAYRIERPGGGLDVHDLTGAPADDRDTLVLALHGITANALTWEPVATALATAAPSVRVLAPDLRGRAGSREITGPWGLGAHADDVIAVADAFGAARVVLLGHSMGAFVAALTAARHPERVSALVLVDGGVSFPAPAGLDIDQALAAVLGPAMDRLSLRFADADAYLDFWRVHPALQELGAGPQAGALRAYLLHDLVRDGDAFVSSCVGAAVRADGADVLVDTEVQASAARAVAAGVPVELLWAERGLMNESQGLYDRGRLAALGLPTALDVTAVPDTNHYTIVLGDRGVDAVVGAVCRQLPAHQGSAEGRSPGNGSGVEQPAQS